MNDIFTLMTTGSGNEIVFVYAPLANVLQAIISIFKKISQLFSKWADESDEDCNMWWWKVFCQRYKN